jgi:hypothetical protein
MVLLKIMHWAVQGVVAVLAARRNLQWLIPSCRSLAAARFVLPMSPRI